MLEEAAKVELRASGGGSVGGSHCPNMGLGRWVAHFCFVRRDAGSEVAQDAMGALAVSQSDAVMCRSMGAMPLLDSKR